MNSILLVLVGFWTFGMVRAAAEPSAFCARIKLTRVTITHQCVQHDEGCFAEFELDGEQHHVPFRSSSDGSLPEIGFSARACAGVNVDSKERPLRLPPGCEVSINLGGPRGAAGEKCLCTLGACPERQKP